jgi:peptidoglycan/LPS O-acetylase OafA/YrhL
LLHGHGGGEASYLVPFVIHGPDPPLGVVVAALVVAALLAFWVIENPCIAPSQK